MPFKITLISKHNQYDTKFHFAQKLAEGFRSLGLEVDEYQGNLDEKIWRRIFQKANQDFVLSFNRSGAFSNGVYWWDQYGLPSFSLLVDPVYYARELFTSKQAILTCVDRGDVEFAKSHGCERVFFLPHAADRDLFDQPPIDKEYGVVLIGSCYDPDSFRAEWQKKLPPELAQVVEEAVQCALGPEQIHFYDAVIAIAKTRGIEEEVVLTHNLPFYVDHFMRGYDRLRLLQAIRDVPVHVFGGTCMQVKGWNYYLKGQSNIVLHPSLPFPEAIQIMRKAKICLNSVPSFPDGSHERVFYSLGGYCLPFTTESRFLREEFGELIGYYRHDRLSSVNDDLIKILRDEKDLKERVESARAIARSRHTWDQRAQTLVGLMSEFACD